MNLLDKYDTSPKQFYDVYRITIVVEAPNRIIGGHPLNPLVIAGDQQAKKPKKSYAELKTKVKERDELTEQQDEENLEAIEGQEKEERSWIGFPRNSEGQMYMFARCPKACIKETVSVHRILQDRPKTEHLKHGTEIKPEGLDHGNQLLFYRITTAGRMYVTEPDGCEERAIQVMTMQGPRTAIKKTDYLTDVYCTFDWWVAPTHPADTRHIKEEELVRILTLAQENGLWADRSIGEGKFRLVNVEKVQDGVAGKEPKEKKTAAKKTTKAPARGRAARKVARKDVITSNDTQTAGRVS